MINLKTSITLLGIISLLACSENKIKVKEERAELPESDKELRIKSEVHESIWLISKEIRNSDEIVTCEHGKKLINSGEEDLLYLKDVFMDSTETTVYSNFNERNLTSGELAIIIAGEIKLIPIARVVGVQQCTPPFDFDIEHYLDRIKENPSRFSEEYTNWIKGVK